MKYVAIVSARMGSSRFPGKVMAELWNGKSALQILLERLKLSKKLDKIVVGTTPELNNKPIEDLCDKMNISYCFGDVDEALTTVYNTAKIQRIVEADKISIIDITADCPFIDPFQIDDMIESFNKNAYHYLSNCMIRSYPIGFDIQIYRDTLLDIVYFIVTNKKHRIHSGWNIWAYSHVLQLIYCDEFAKSIKYGNIIAAEKYNHPDWRIVLDYKEDLEFLKNIINHFNRIDFTYQEIIDFLKENPELLKININCKQKIPGKDK